MQLDMQIDSDNNGIWVIFKQPQIQIFLSINVLTHVA